jgi:hypothetical protein
LEEHLLQHINNDVEQEGGERIALLQTSTALNPSPRDAIKEDRSLASLIDQVNPRTP